MQLPFLAAVVQALAAVADAAAAVQCGGCVTVAAAAMKTYAK